MIFAADYIASNDQSISKKGVPCLLFSDCKIGMPLLLYYGQQADLGFPKS